MLTLCQYENNYSITSRASCDAKICTFFTLREAKRIQAVIYENEFMTYKKVKTEKIVKRLRKKLIFHSKHKLEKLNKRCNTLSYTLK